MRTCRAIVLVEFLLLPLLVKVTTSGAMAQGTFQNLSFEQAVFVPVSPEGGGPYHWTPALPGWTGESTQTGIIHQVYGRNELLPINGGLVVVGTGPGSLVPRFGSYGLAMLATPGEVISLWQNGVIPADARSVQMATGSGGPGAVTINGIPLDVVLVESAFFHSVYAADISSFSGQPVELRFSVTGSVTGQPSELNLWHLEFSPVPVPEPSTLALLALAVLLPWLRRRFA